MFPGQILCSLWLFLLPLYHQSTMWVTFRWYIPSAQWREGIVRCNIVNTKSGRVRLLQWCKIAPTYIWCILCLPIVDTILQSRHAANSRTVLLMHIYDADACIRSRPGANSKPEVYIWCISLFVRTRCSSRQQFLFQGSRLQSALKSCYTHVQAIPETRDRSTSANYFKSTSRQPDALDAFWFLHITFKCLKNMLQWIDCVCHGCINW